MFHVELMEVKMKSTIAKKTEGYGYKYTELADINKYCEENSIRYYQEVETSEINQKDYIITYLIKDGKVEKHRGCQIVDAVLQGIKNPVQEYGSSLTYCRRYSLLMALGLATEDDDAQSLTEKKEPTQEDADNYKLSFGKFKGKTLKEIQAEKPDYITWLLGNTKDEYMIKIIELATGRKIPSEEEQKEILELTVKLKKLAIEKKVDFEVIRDNYDVKSSRDMTLEQLKDCVQWLESITGDE